MRTNLQVCLRRMRSINWLTTGVKVINKQSTCVVDTFEFNKKMTNRLDKLKIKNEASYVAAVDSLSHSQLQKLCVGLMHELKLSTVEAAVQAIEKTQKNEANLPENWLHTRQPDAKKADLYEMVFNREMRYKNHKYNDIESFVENFTIVGTSKKLVEYYNYNEGSMFITNHWSDDPLFKSLLTKQKKYTKTLNNSRYCGVFYLQNITYCLLIKYEDNTKKTQYQIYIGQDTTTGRWNRSGTNHMASIRNILNKKPNNKYEVCDLALAYFGPENAVLFTIGHSYDEQAFSHDFHIDGKRYKMTNDPISLSPIAGAAKSKKNEEDDE